MAGDAVTAGDAAQLASLHRATMPYSILGALGTGTLERYYLWVAASTSEHLFLARDGHAIVGAAVLSLSPSSVIRRFVAARPWTFAAAALARVLGDSQFRRQVRAFLTESVGDDAHLAPELLQVFVAPQSQGRATGTALLGRVEAWLRAHGQRRYFVRTLADDNIATRAFYERRGFTPAGERVFCGARFAVLVKEVE